MGVENSFGIVQIGNWSCLVWVGQTWFAKTSLDTLIQTCADLPNLI